MRMRKSFYPDEATAMMVISLTLLAGVVVAIIVAAL